MAVNHILNPELCCPELMSKIRAGLPVSVFGMSEGERLHVASGVDQFFLYVTTDFVEARRATKQLNQLIGGAVHLPPRTDVLTYRQAQSATLGAERALALYAIASNAARCAVVTIDTLIQLLPQKDDWEALTMRVNVSRDYDLDAIAATLTKSGYMREALVESVGQWSLRGDILDVFPIGRDRPVRLEFFGDTLESMKTFDAETQVSSTRLQDLVVPPMCEVVIPDSRRAELAKKIVSDGGKKLEPDFQARYDRISGDLAAKLEGGATDASMEFLLPYLESVTLSEWLPPSTVIIYDETKAVFDFINTVEKEHQNRFKALLETGEVALSTVKQTIGFEEYKRRYGKFQGLSFARLTSSNFFFNPQQLFNFNCSPITRYSLNYAELTGDINGWLSRDYRVLIAGRDEQTAREIVAKLKDAGVWAITGTVDDAFLTRKSDSRVLVLERELEKGFSYHETGFVVIGTYDLLPQKASALKKVNSRKLFVQPVAGDYVVHYVHGIGKCLGTTRLETSMGVKDYVEIEYRDGDKLYVPVDQMDLLSKFSGAEPRLSKMGGKEFARVKERVKSGIREMAVDLVKLYGAREKARGHKFDIDEGLMQEFVDKFPYESTPDQLQAFDEIKKDLRAGKIMDRLLVGDVGYGKTEVALRAAFAVIADSKQVALMCPTTILSEQHFLTAKSRFEGYGVRIAVINRFASKKEQTQIIAKLEKGELDLVIGTHRLLSKDVRFQNLGLLILDEEQRFGVADKEKIKEYKNTVNVLTMTATPIPRTLHMSMTGIRDISTLANPPSDRLPVQTYVTEYTESLVRDSIEREISRGGQVYVIYNRVETIHRFAAKLVELMPHVRIVVGHGQMNESELEQNIKTFYDGGADVLISTTIVENGIDLPSANTMIVVNADYLGLSQLYQLRGRVGRSNRLAYAYFTYAAGKLLSETATKRLSTLMEFTEFGSGFRIAMRDLEIRGAGNVLGREQHGHMEKVGYDLYCKMLAEVVGELRSAADGADEGGVYEEPETQCSVYMDVDAYIPNDFIPDTDGRMSLYARIAAIRSGTDRERLLKEIKDVYGDVPKPLANLVTIGLYKGLGVRIGAEEIKISKTSASVTLKTMSKWMAHSASFESLGLVLKPTKSPIIVFEPQQGVTYYERVFRFLAEAIRLKKAAQ